MPRKKLVKDFSSKSPAPLLRPYTDWPEEDRELISSVETKHGFTTEYLAPAIMKLDFKWSSIRASIQQLPSEAEKLTKIKNIRNVAVRMKESLHTAGAQTKIDLFLNSHADANSCFMFEKSLNKLIAECDKQAKKAVKSGRPFDALRTNFMVLLMYLFEEGTNKKPVISKTTHLSDSYTGAFYLFLKDMHPFIKRHFFKPCPALKTLANIAYTTRSHYKKLTAIKQ